MTKIEDLFRNQPRPLILDAVDEDGFRISGIRVDVPILLRPDRILQWSPTQMNALTAADFAPILDSTDSDESNAHCDILVFGNGPIGTGRPPASIYEALRLRGVGLEVMETRAACRAYHLLASERRRVAAALIPSYSASLAYNTSLGKIEEQTA